MSAGARSARIFSARSVHAGRLTIYGDAVWDMGRQSGRWGPEASTTAVGCCEIIAIVTNSFHQPHRSARAGAPLVALPHSAEVPARASSEGDPPDVRAD